MQVFDMNKMSRNFRMPKGWINLNRCCPKCREYIPRFNRACPSCGTFVKNISGKVFIAK